MKATDKTAGVINKDLLIKRINELHDKHKGSGSNKLARFCGELIDDVKNDNMIKAHGAEVDKLHSNILRKEIHNHKDVKDGKVVPLIEKLTDSKHE